MKNNEQRNKIMAQVVKNLEQVYDLFNNFQCFNMVSEGFLMIVNVFEGSKTDFCKKQKLTSNYHLKIRWSKKDGSSNFINATS